MKKIVKTVKYFPRNQIKIPPSKSVAHRAIICAALAEGINKISPVQLSDDISATIHCVRTLGAEVLIKGESLEIKGIAKPFRSSAVLDCGESGSTLRFLIPVAAAMNTQAVFSGKGRLMERPMEIYENIFKDGFSRIDNKIQITKNLTNGDYILPGDVSSQFISGMLMALPILNADSTLKITGNFESKSYIDITIDTMRAFGVNIEHKERYYRILSDNRYSPADFTVEADFSQAAFFLVAAALGAEITVSGLKPDSVQGDRAIIDILKKSGADIISDKSGCIVVKAQNLTSQTVNAENIPDLVPILAVLFSFCEGESRITNAGRLRLKESDRLEAITNELTKIGADIKIAGDSLIIKGKDELYGGETDSWNDHRIAMALAVAAVRCKNPVTINRAEAVGKSFPDFWEIIGL